MLAVQREKATEKQNTCSVLSGEMHKALSTADRLSALSSPQTSRWGSAANPPASPHPRKHIHF